MRELRSPGVRAETKMMMVLGRRGVVLRQTLTVLRQMSVVLRHLYGVETNFGGVPGLRRDILRGLRSPGDVGAKPVGVEAKYGRLRRWCVQRMGEGGSGFRGKGAWRRASHVEGLRRRRVEPAWRGMAWRCFRVKLSRRRAFEANPRIIRRHGPWRGKAPLRRGCVKASVRPRRGCACSRI